jgi:hypothetical protein
MDYNKKYNISFKGLSKGDYIEYSKSPCFCVKGCNDPRHIRKCLVLKIKLKLSLKTKHGISKYFNYTVLQDNQTIIIKLQNIKIHSIMRSK